MITKWGHINEFIRRKLLLLVAVFYAIFSHGHAKESTLHDSIPPPVIVKAGTPEIHHIQDYPPPQIIELSDYKPAAETPADFFIPMKAFNTEDGLAMSSILCGHKDDNGILWFGTSGNGVSRYDGKAFTNFNSSNGLIHNLISCITQDSKGNIWFGTYGGISVYNGRSFINYTTKQGLCDNDINSILQDRQGNIWIGTQNGISKIKQENINIENLKFTNYDQKDGLLGNNVFTIYEDYNDSLWFGTDNGFYKFNPDTTNGKVFVDFSKDFNLEGETVMSIVEDKLGDLWLSTDNGIYSKNNTVSLTYSNEMVNNYVYCGLIDKNDNIWLGTTNGIFRYSIKEKKFLNISSEQGLTNNDVKSIIQDSGGSLWFGTLGGGLCRYDGTSIISFTAEQGLPNSIVYSVAEDKNSKLYFGTNDVGITKYTPGDEGIIGKSFANFGAEQGLPEEYVLCTLADRDGNLWLGTTENLIKFDGKTFQKFTTEQGLINNYVVSLEEDHLGNLWIGTYEGGLSKFDGSSFTNYTVEQGLVHNTVWDIMEDVEGNLWFATRGGLSIFTADSFINYTIAQGLPDNKLSSVLKDQSGNILIGTWGKGIAVIRNNIVEKLFQQGTPDQNIQIFENYSTNNGLSNNVVYKILEDSTGNIFIGTNEGITVLKGGLDPSGKNVAATGIKNFNQKTGYPIKDVSNNNAMYIDSRGHIWVGTGDKLLRFNYSKIENSQKPPRVLIQNVKINNENISWYSLLKATTENISSENIDNYVFPFQNDELLTFGKILSKSERDTLNKKFKTVQFDSILPFYSIPQNLELPYAFNSISFEFIGVETRQAFLVQYQYKLEGYDDKWSPPSTVSTASYGKLPSGEYTFLLRAQSPDKVWSVPISYQFKIFPPWYATWFAYSFYAILFILGIFLVDRIQRRRLIAKERQRAMTKELEQAKEIEKSYHELKVAQKQLVHAEKMASLGELTAGIAHEIQNPLNFIKNFSEVNTELIVELNEEIDNGDLEEAKAIARDIARNEEKIIHHGKRADGIVKGMLQHSRSNPGLKEAFDINALADEYLRLAYHGLRAKDKSFNANMHTDFDESIVNINIIPQDMGRVLLNLITNAFYSVNEKKKSGIEAYEPMVTVSTKKTSEDVVISVIDNGNGIPKHVQDKIFQPFFTTKPSGEGTGLGLSMSYDIITKGHGGELKVETKEGEFTEFKIILPKL